MRNSHSRRRWGALTGTAVTVATLLTTLAPSASATETGNPPTWNSVLQAELLRRASGDNPSAADIAAVKRDPVLSKLVVDPSRTETTVDEAIVTEDGQYVDANGKPLTAAQIAKVTPPKTATPSDDAAVTITPAENDVDPQASPLISRAVTGGKWRMTHITHTHRSYFGTVIFKYHTYAEFNYANGQVRAWGDRSDDFTEADEVVDIEPKLIVDSKSRVPASSGTSMMKRKVALCAFRYGCYATLYPWARVKVYGTGKTKYDGSGV